MIEFLDGRYKEAMKASIRFMSDNYYEIPLKIRKYIEAKKLPDGYVFKPQTLNRTINLFKDDEYICSLTYELIEDCDTSVIDAVVDRFINDKICKAGIGENYDR